MYLLQKKQVVQVSLHLRREGGDSGERHPVRQYQKKRGLWIRNGTLYIKWVFYDILYFSQNVTGFDENLLKLILSLDKFITFDENISNSGSLSDKFAPFSQKFKKHRVFG